MRLPVIKGVIERRVLVNYRVDKDVLQRVLPAPFRVKTVAGAGIAGICLIRLRGVRPRFLPAALGLSSENAAHRIAVEWDTDDGVREGVYVPRRDTSSWINTMLGGRLFPGEHHRATFAVTDDDRGISIDLRSNDGATHVKVVGTATDRLPATSVFASTEDASQFFENGSIGYSATRRTGHFECLELKTFKWRVEPLNVESVGSSFFDDQQQFPSGSTQFDSALLMRAIPHEWRAHQPMRSQPGSQSSDRS